MCVIKINVALRKLKFKMQQNEEQWNKIANTTQLIDHKMRAIDPHFARDPLNTQRPPL
jgi:hypothetical protein